MAESGAPPSSLASALSENGFVRSVSVILVSEIGDKTFLVAAILAMRHPRLIIFAGAFAALAVMSVLSAMLGHIVPTLLPKRWTTLAAAILFWVFGAKMLSEGLAMEAGNESIQEEMREVQKEIEEEEGDGDNIALEEGRGSGLKNGSSSSSGERLGSRSQQQADGQQLLHGLKNLVSLMFTPVFIQSFVLTFLAEWGDRSQITTIALGAAHNVWIVSLGTILGHACCTCGAVLGGRWLATKISVKHVTLGGAALFLLFGLAYTYEAWYFHEEIEAVLAAP